MHPSNAGSIRDCLKSVLILPAVILSPIVSAYSTVNRRKRRLGDTLLEIVTAGSVDVVPLFAVELITQSVSKESLIATAYQSPPVN